MAIFIFRSVKTVLFLAPRLSLIALGEGYTNVKDNKKQLLLEYKSNEEKRKRKKTYLIYVYEHCLEGKSLDFHLISCPPSFQRLCTVNQGRVRDALLLACLQHHPPF